MKNIEWNYILLNCATVKLDVLFDCYNDIELDKCVFKLCYGTAKIKFLFVTLK